MLKTTLKIFLIFIIIFFQESVSNASLGKFLKELFSKNDYKITSNKETSSPYWSNTPDGPLTINEAKKLLQKNNLDPIEGIWYSKDFAIIVIFKDKNSFKFYIIETIDKSIKQFNGTLEATIFKKKNKYTFQSRVWYSNRNGSIAYYKTQPGELKLIEKNKIIQDFDSLSEQGVDMDGVLTKLWP